MTTTTPARPQSRVLRTPFACAYIRLSTDTQVEEGWSLGAQIKAIQEYCSLKNYTIGEVDFFTEEDGQSGRKAHRPAWERMLEAIRTGTYDIFVIWKLDRIARDPVIGYRLKAALDFGNCEIESVTEPQIKNRLMFGITLLMAEQESANTSERVRLAFRAMTKQGRVSGKVKYGYSIWRDGDWDERAGKLVRGPNYGLPIVNEHEAKVVRRVFKEYLNGSPIGVIADDLHRDGIYPRSGKPWSLPSIRLLLRGEHYIGETTFGKRHVVLQDDGNRDVVKLTWTSEDEWIKVPFPPIVDEHTWRAVQERLTSRRSKAQRKYPKQYFPLRYLVWCESCDTAYACHTAAGDQKRTLTDGTVRRYPRKTAVRAYVCGIGRYKGKTVCPDNYINADYLESVVWGYLAEVLLDEAKLHDLFKDELREQDASAQDAEHRRLQRKLKELKGEHDRLITMGQKGFISDDEIALRLRPIKAETSMYQDELRKLNDWQQHRAQLKNLYEGFASAAANIRPKVEKYSNQEKGKLMERLVSQVVISTPIQVVLQPGSFVINPASRPWRSHP